MSEEIKTFIRLILPVGPVSGVLPWCQGTNELPQTLGAGLRRPVSRAVAAFVRAYAAELVRTTAPPACTRTGRVLNTY